MPNMKIEILKFVSNYSNGITFRDLISNSAYILETSDIRPIDVTNTILDSIEEGLVVADNTEARVKYKLTDKGYDYIEV